MDIIYSEILNTIQHGIILTDNEYNITYINNTAIQITNQFTKKEYLIDNYIGKNIFIFYPQIEGHFIDTDKIEITINDKLGLEFIYKKILIQNNKYYLFTINNISFQIYNDQYEKKEMITFMACISHEIRNSLQGISMAAYLLTNTIQNKTNDNENSIKSYLSIINKGTNDIKRIINDVLDLSKINTEEFVLEYGIYDINELISNIINDITLYDTVVEKQLKIHFTPYNLNNESILKLYTDNMRLSQIIINLLSNAIKYTPSFGSIEIKINITSEYIIIDIIDSGVGISQKDIPFLFKKCCKTENNFKYNIKGNGLGLYLSQKIAKLLGGYINVDSKVGIGSTFSIYHPILFDHHIKYNNDNDNNNDNKVNINYKKDYSKKINILMIDDNINNVETFRMLISNFDNVNVTALTSINQLEEKYNNFDMIFLDINMPDINGFELCKQIKNDGYKGPIIALTGNILVTNNVNNIFDDTIIKPYDDKIIFNKIKTQLENLN